MLSKGYIRNRVISKVNHILIKLWIFRLFFPSEIYISLNSICNARCKMCDIGIRNSKTDFFKMHEGKGDMSEKTFLNLAESIKIKA